MDEDVIGNTPRYLSSYRGPPLINEDAMLMKNFHVTERSICNCAGMPITRLFRAARVQIEPGE